ncbi:MAG TPA: HAD-IA family hydrolase [Opitutaceae bacterium]|jgi:putative hydrolase of the HAD superfamily|nr:HAD-IA family hydrolase [Opitutaceae bacterium]
MEAFVFDADGVICVGANFSMALNREYGISHGHLEDFFSGPFADCIVGRRDLKKALAPFLPTWGWRFSLDEFLRFWFRQEHVVCPEALACVRNLRKRGHLCVLATNQEKYRASYLRREMGLEDEFDRVFPSCEIGAAKPSAEFFLALELHLGKPAHELCLVDDSERNVIGAEACGWRTIRYRGKADLKKLR